MTDTELLEWVVKNEARFIQQRGRYAVGFEHRGEYHQTAFAFQWRIMIEDAMGMLRELQRYET